MLHLLPTLQVGGAEKMAAELMAGLTIDFIPEVATLGRATGSAVESMLCEVQIPILHLDKGMGPSPSSALQLISHVRASKPQVIHTHQYALKYALPASRLLRIPVVHTVHSLADTEVRKIDRWVHAWAFRSGVHPVAIAREVEASFRKVYGRTPAATIANGVRVESFVPRAGVREVWRQRHGAGSEDLLITCIGRLAAPKNQRLLLRAFARLRPAPGIRMLFVGDGPLRQEIIDVSSELGVRDRVEFLGTRDDVADILAASDVFVLGSDWEGNPLSIMEAMAAGLPVVATDVGGVSELVRHEETGILVPAGDDGHFSRELGRLLASRELRGRFGRAGARYARETFDISKMVAQYAELYRRIIQPDAS